MYKILITTWLKSKKSISLTTVVVKFETKDAALAAMTNALKDALSSEFRRSIVLL